MQSIAGGLLAVLLTVMFQNWRRGTLGQWARAKFLNDPGPGAPSSPAASSAAGIGAGSALGSVTAPPTGTTLGAATKPPTGTTLGAYTSPGGPR